MAAGCCPRDVSAAKGQSRVRDRKRGDLFRARCAKEGLPLQSVGWSFS